MLSTCYQTIALSVVLLANLSIVFSEHAYSADQCGEISIAKMSWPSAELIAEIDKAILSAGYDCEAQLVDGDTLPTVTSMTEQNAPDIAPELWVDALREPINAAVESGEMILATEVLADGGEEGWWIPKYVADQNPQIKTPDDALERPDLFPSPQDESRGAVYNCPVSWKACYTITANLFNAYNGNEKGFDLVETGSAAELDGSIAQAHQRELGWLGYYWAPTAMLGRYEMVKLEMGEHDKEHWRNCTSVTECENPEVNGWARSEVFSAVTDNFAARAGDAMQYINKRQWDNDTMNKLLAWMADNQATGEEVAAHFLENYEDLWFSWVSMKAMVKIRAAL